MTFRITSLSFVATLRLDASGRFVLSADGPLAWTVGRPWLAVRENLEWRKRWSVEAG